MPTRVYEYGLLSPITNAKLVDEQISAAHRYRNVLTEIEIERRTKIREAMAAHPDLEPLQQRIDQLKADRENVRLAIKAARAKTRSRSESAELRAKAKSLGAEIAGLVEKIKATRSAIVTDPEIQDKITAANDAARARRREERAKTSTFWGTYLLIEADADAASKSKTPPKFMRWTGEGRVSVQIQGGMTPEELFGPDRRAQIDPVPADTWSDTIGRRRRQGKTKLRLRIGSEGRDPIFAEWPMMLHRPLPPEGRIKVVTVSRVRRDCRMWYWRVHLTIELPDGWTRGKSGEGVCALNLGWHKRPDGSIRAGYVIGEQPSNSPCSDDISDYHEILVPRSVIDRVEKSESIQSYRDKNLEEMRPALVVWLTEHRAELPQWLTERTETLHAWRSAARFAALAKAWRAQRFDGDAFGYELIEAWRYRDEHLQRYAAGLLRGALFHRREVYRLMAIKLAERYHTLVIDSFDLRETQTSPQPEDAKPEIRGVKRNQRHAAGSVLRLALINAFARVGGNIVKLGAENVTRTCSFCGATNDWDRSDGERMHTCVACAATWDQDANACRNLLTSYRIEQHRSSSEPGGARTGQALGIKKESRSERLRNARAKLTTSDRSI